LDDELEVCARLGGLVAVHLQVPYSAMAL